VPVEIGSSYLAEDYSQKLMTVDDFLHSFLGQSDEDNSEEDVVDETNSGDAVKSGQSYINRRATADENSGLHDIELVFDNNAAAAEATLS
jgi:hypothetical protein